LSRRIRDRTIEAVEATGKVAGSLRINTLSMAAGKIIAPRLGRFHRAYPQVVLDIVIDDTLTDIVAGRFDAGIRVGERLEKDMVAVRLTPDVQMVAVAAPDYLDEHGEPQSPADLHHHASFKYCCSSKLTASTPAYIRAIAVARAAEPQSDGRWPTDPA
jgi:DNA-binding transcriptional LysR family regulator